MDHMQYGYKPVDLNGGGDARYVERVLAAQREAHRLGIGGVPAILIGGADLPLSEAENLSGAQPYEIVRAAVARAVGSAKRTTRLEVSGLPYRALNNTKPASRRVL